MATLAKFLFIFHLICMILFPVYGVNGQSVEGLSDTKPTPKVLVDSTLSKNGTCLHFHWDTQQPALAVVKIYQGLNKQIWWIVFDEAAELKLPEGSLRDLKHIERIQTNDNSVVQITTNQLTMPIVSREGNEWRITFSPYRSVASKIAQTKLPQSQQEALSVDLEGTGKEVRLLDPQTGYTYVIFPSFQLGFKMDQQQSYPEFRVMETAQGIALQLLKDDLVVTKSASQVSIAHPLGLAISSFSERNRQSSSSLPAGFFTEAADLEWSSRLQKLNVELLDLPHDQHGPLELEMAWLSISHGHNVQALGYLTHLAQERPSIAQTKIFHLLSGMGNLLLNRLPEAEEHLWACREDPEVQIWLNLIKALTQPSMISNNPKSFSDFRVQMQNASAIVKHYPKPLRIQLTTWILLAGIAVNDLEIINSTLADEDRPDNASVAEVYDLARARLLMCQNKPDAALQIMGELMEKARSPIVQSIARYDYIVHRVATNLMNKSDAIPQLETLRLQWHGSWLANHIDDYVDSLRN